MRQISGCAVPSSARGVERDVTGGQLTLDLLVSHNQSHPPMQVSPNDLLPSPNPDHLCRGTIPLKNVVLMFGCPVRAEPPNPMTHNETADFDNLAVEVLRKRIVERYMASAFNNCRNQKLKMMSTEEPLKLFVDPKVKPVSIHKAAVIHIHLKEAVKADLDTDVRLGILVKVDINSPVKWLSRMIVTLKKDGTPRRIIDYKRLNDASRVRPISPKALLCVLVHVLPTYVQEMRTPQDLPR